MSGANSGSLDCKVYVGNLGNEGSRSELERVFGYYGTLRNVWVARNPPGFAFVQFEDTRDAEDAVHALDGRTICGVRARVEMSSGMSRRGGGGGRERDRSRDYGRYDNYDNSYNSRRGGRHDRSLSPSPTRRHSKSRSRSPLREKRRSRSRSPSYKTKSSLSPRRSMSPLNRSNSASRSPRSRSRS